MSKNGMIFRSNIPFDVCCVCLQGSYFMELIVTCKMITTVFIAITIYIKFCLDVTDQRAPLNPVKWNGILLMGISWHVLSLTMVILPCISDSE